MTHKRKKEIREAALQSRAILAIENELPYKTKELLDGLIGVILELTDEMDEIDNWHGKLGLVRTDNQDGTFTITTK